MKKTIILIGLLVLFDTMLEAQALQVSEQEIIISTENYYTYKKNKTFPGINNIETYSREGSVLLYEAVLEDGSALLYSGHRACHPILGDYFLGGGMSIIEEIRNNTLPDNIGGLINGYIEQLDSAFHSNDTNVYCRSEWKVLVEGDLLSDDLRYVQGDTLIFTKWGQSKSNDYSDSVGDYYAYNYFVQPDPNDTCMHCLAGCVAVAMGQVMNYWHSPLIDYSKDIQFDWCNMANSLNTSSLSYLEERNAVAFLLSECGKSVDMNYGCKRSGASLQDARDALVEKFKYSSNAYYRMKTIFETDESWMDRIRKNVKRGQPVIYAASRENGFLDYKGHAFVCDGFRGNEFHINWGWRGRYNGFFRLDRLHPEDTLLYDYFHEAIFDIHPEYFGNICDLDVYLDAFYSVFELIGNSNTPLYCAVPQTATILNSASVASSVAWRTIPSGATAVYRAHEEINLQDGFEALYGSDFTAEIIPCPQCETNMLTRTRYNEGEYAGIEESVFVNYLQDVFDTKYEMQYCEISPNPTDGPLTIITDGKVEVLVIYNTRGSIVGGWSYNAITDNLVSIDVSNLHSGFYIVSFKDNRGWNASKIIKTDK